VVTVEILDESDNVHRQGVDQGSDLLGLSRGSEEIDHLLHGSGSVHVERDTNKVVGNRLDDGHSLLVGRVLEQFLAQVVAERIRHELGEMTVGLSEDHVSVGWLAVLELLLQVSAAVLILAKVEQIALELLNLDTSETVDWHDQRHIRMLLRARRTFSISFSSLVLQADSSARVDRA
jgi:hypothetical protein